jgi:predicted DCC family thiol-disulfide oxidoreductase YuxK
MGRTKHKQTVRKLPDRPTLVYDGRCGFCLCHVQRWKRLTGDAVDHVASASPEIAERFPEIPRDQLNRSLHFIDTDGHVYPGAYGALKALSHANPRDWRLKLYENSRLCAGLMECGYRLVAANRGLLSRLSPCARRMRR